MRPLTANLMSPTSSAKPEVSVPLVWVLGTGVTLALAFSTFVLNQNNLLGIKIDKTNDNVAAQGAKLSALNARQTDIIQRLDHVDTQLDNIEKDLHGQWVPITPRFNSVASTSSVANGNGI